MTEGGRSTAGTAIPPTWLAALRRSTVQELAAGCAGREMVTIVGKPELVTQLTGLGIDPSTVRLEK